MIQSNMSSYTLNKATKNISVNMIDGSERYNDQIHKINGFTKIVLFNKSLNLRI